MATRVLTAEFPDSTAVRRAEYDADTDVLTIVFKNKGVGIRDTYQYAEVPKREWDKLTSAKSVGRYVTEHIVHHYKEVIAEDEATRGRAALKLVEELLKESDRMLPGGYLLKTSTTFDRAWLPKARKLLGR